MFPLLAIMNNSVFQLLEWWREKCI